MNAVYKSFGSSIWIVRSDYSENDVTVHNEVSKNPIVLAVWI